MVKAPSMPSHSFRESASTRAIEAIGRVLIKAAAVLIVLNSVGLMHGAHADEATPPRHFVCTFDKGSSWTYDNGKFQSTNAAPLAFEFGKIDLDKQTASLVVDGKDSSTLRVVRALNGMHFIEVMLEGYMSVTTVYDRDPKTGRYPAVHSRHMAVLGSPLVAQYYGACAPR